MPLLYFPTIPKCLSASSGPYFKVTVSMRPICHHIPHHSPSLFGLHLSHPLDCAL